MFILYFIDAALGVYIYCHNCYVFVKFWTVILVNDGINDDEDDFIVGCSLLHCCVILYRQYIRSSSREYSNWIVLSSMSNNFLYCCKRFKIA